MGRRKQTSLADLAKSLGGDCGRAWALYKRARGL